MNACLFWSGWFWNDRVAVVVVTFACMMTATIAGMLVDY